MDKATLALSKCDELERLIRKNKQSANQGSGSSAPNQSTSANENYLKDMQRIVFDDASVNGEKYFYSQVLEILPGMAAFRVGCLLESATSCEYCIEVYHNNILLETKSFTSSAGEVCDCVVSVCAYIYEKHNKISLHIFEMNKTAAFDIKGLSVAYNQAEVLTQGDYETFAKPQGRAHIFAAAIHNGLSKDGVELQKYAYAIRDGKNPGNILVGECDANNFAFGQEVSIAPYSTFDSEADFCLSYNTVPATAAAAATYRYLVLLSPGTNDNYYFYKNISTNGNYSGCRLLKGVSAQATPASNNSKSYYLAASLTKAGKICFNYLRTNVVADSEITYSTGTWANVQKLSLTKTNSLTQAVKTIPLVLLRENTLYTAIYSKGEPIIVSGISEKITDLSDSLFVSDDSMDLYVYVKVNGYLKRYHLVYNESSESYSYDSSITIGYGISEFMPLLNGDAFLAYGNSFYYTDKVDRFVC